MTKTLELTERQTRRFERIKEACTDEHVPAPSDQMIVSSLLDTWDAVDKGHYAGTNQVEDHD